MAYNAMINPSERIFFVLRYINPCTRGGCGERSEDEEKGEWSRAEIGLDGRAIRELELECARGFGKVGVSW